MEKEKIHNIDIDTFSERSMLSFTEAEKKMLEAEMLMFWKLMSKLDEIDVSNVEETEHILNKYNVFREDKVSMPFSRDEMLNLASSKSEGCITVPRVVEE